MSIIACPKCRRQYQVKGDPTGRSVKCANCQHTFTAQVQQQSAQPAQTSPARQAQVAAGVGGQLTSQPGLFPDVVPGGPDPLGNHIVQDPGFAEVDVDEIKRERLAAARKNNKLENAFSTSSSMAKMNDEETRKEANRVRNVGYLSGDTLFGYDGRISRKKYWISSILYGIISMVIMIVLIVGYSLILYAIGIDLPEAGSADMWDSLSVVAPIFFITFVVGILSAWVSFALMTKRYHDIGRDGSRLILLLIPIVGGIWVFIEVGFFPGVPGKNQWGPNPLTQKPPKK